MTLDYDALSRVVASTLELPYCKGKGQSFQIAKAVIQSMKTALQSGETVRIRGIGTFKPKWSEANAVNVIMHGPHGFTRMRHLYPRRRRIIFNPHYTLKLLPPLEDA